MGSVRHRLAEARMDCNVVLVGDCKVGKTALVNKLVGAKFTEAYRPTSFEKYTNSTMVAGRRVKFTVWDMTGTHHPTSANTVTTRALAYNTAEAFLLCYKISDPSTLFSALNFWAPELRASAPQAPIILVGCQGDTRADRDVIAQLAKQGKAPVSSPQALSFSQQMGALAYVETSSALKGRGVEAAFEAACLAANGLLAPKPRSGNGRFGTPSPPRAHSVGASGRDKRFSASNSASTSPADSLERSGDNLYKLEPTEQFWDQFHLNTPTKNGAAPPIMHAKTPSLSSTVGSTSRSASLSSKTRSSTSIPSISSYGSSLSKTPKSGRRAQSLSKEKNSDGMITIKCQRLTADKTYEEIEVEVPAPIYETIQFYNAESPNGPLGGRSNKERRSFGHKLRNLFSGNKKEASN